jgi:phenylalanyl-tRNA synthetase beta chain
VRRTSKELGFKTEASIRFERGGDIASPPVGIARAAALFDQIGAGRAIGPLIDRYAAPRPAQQVRLRRDQIARLLGTDVPAEDVPRILTPLGFDVRGESGSWTATVPTFRVDVTREADLVEEVGRHYGFDRIPATFPALTAPQPPPDPNIAREWTLRQLLTASGFSEAMTFAFIEREAALPFIEGAEPAAIANPLSEKYAVLRPSLLPGLLDSSAHNRRRARKDIQLFEIGSRFSPDSGEGRAATVIWSGAADGPHWSAATRLVDFFDIKGVLEHVGRAYGVHLDFVAAERPYLARGRAAEVQAWTADDRAVSIGVAGQLVPALADARGFPPAEEIYAAEIDLNALFSVAAGDDLKAESLPRYPAIVRDLSILVSEALPASAVRGTIRSAAPSTLVSIVEFDRYTGKGVPQDKISLSLRLTFRAHDRTLTDEDVQAAMDAIVSALRATHGAEQR